jgi:hypothetical protein
MRPPIALILLLLTTAARADNPVPPSSDDTIERRCQELAAAWKDRLDAEKMHCVVAPPFVIAGDGPPQTIARYRDRTILPAMRAFDAMFFDTPPDHPILILLFESEQPYRRLAQKWFADDDVPHFGYFRHDRVMLMNVATGTGTLVHELVHALIEPDFPRVPRWFNEGLGSLYEQSIFTDDGIRGLENWRLPALQRAIRDNRLRSIREMIQDHNFARGELVGLNYAHARYLLMYLQEKDLLRRYYTAFRGSAADDPHGLETLIKLIEPTELEQFDREWREWVLTLGYASP